jgi:enamine deaminase RidA (YjgF/YER057c/UK114 family)
MDAGPDDRIVERLRELGLELPAASAPVGLYVGAKISGDLAFVSGRVSALRGAVDSEVSAEAARLAARATALEMLAITRESIGRLDRIASIESVRGFVRSSPDFTRQPHIIDGASELLIALWGEAGRHARSSTGVVQLPFGATIQLDMIVRLFPENDLGP